MRTKQGIEVFISLVLEYSAMYLKLHSTPAGEVVAVCDAELLGMVISDGKRHLDLKKHASFYQGEKAAPDDVRKALLCAKNANLVGKKALAAAKKAGIDISGAVLISGVPHLQAYSVF